VAIYDDLPVQYRGNINHDALSTAKPASSRGWATRISTTSSRFWTHWPTAISPKGSQPPEGQRGNSRYFYQPSLLPGPDRFRSRPGAGRARRGQL